MRSLGIFDEQSGRSKSKPVPLTTLTTPGGNPHSSKSPSAIEVAKGVCSLSLIRKGRNATFKIYQIFKKSVELIFWLAKIFHTPAFYIISVSFPKSSFMQVFHWTLVVWTSSLGGQHIVIASVTLPRFNDASAPGSQDWP